MTQIQTYLNHKFSYVDINSNHIDIYDIAHALSNLCRFAGHTQVFYSVAEHSYWMSRMVRGELKKEALLHDAAEAYLVDIPSPLKKMLPDFKVIEDKVDKKIAEVFGISYPHHPDIKKADYRMLQTERYNIMSPNYELWEDMKGIQRYHQHEIGSNMGMEPKIAEERFLEQWKTVK